MKSSSQRIVELDGLRAFAAWVVAIYHMSLYSGALPQGPTWVSRPVTFTGEHGVDVFFIISGFIITRLLLRERERFGSVSLSGFYARRFFRIVPPFATYLLVLAGLRALGAVLISNRNLLWSGLFLQDVAPYDARGWLVGHTWSLSVEEQFYLIFPPVLCYLGFRARGTLIGLGGFYALCVGSLILSEALGRHFGPAWASVKCLYYFRYIVVGVVIAIHDRRVLGVLENKSRFVPAALAIGIIWMAGLRPTGIGLRVLVAAIEPCVCGLFVMWFVANPSRCATLRNPVIQWFGACSYSVYLWQQLFAGPAYCYHGWSPTWAIPSIVAIAACAGASYYLIERPGIRVGHAVSARRRAQKK
jgi:peptidoglycan/LPS O-acetylase OafA/YrhL